MSGNLYSIAPTPVDGDPIWDATVGGFANSIRSTDGTKALLKFTVGEMPSAADVTRVGASTPALWPALAAVLASPEWTGATQQDSDARLRGIVHPHLQGLPMFQIDWRDWPSATGEKTVPVLTWGEGANAGDIVARDWYLLSQVTVSPDAPTVANAGEVPFAHDDVVYWAPEGPAGPSGRDTDVTLYAEDGSVFGVRTISKPYSLEDSKKAAKRRRDRVWSEIENLLLGLLLMGGMDGTAAGAESQRLKEAIGLTAIDAFRSATAMAQPLRDGLDAAQAGGLFTWLDTTVSAAGDVVATIKTKLVRWVA